MKFKNYEYWLIEFNEYENEGLINQSYKNRILDYELLKKLVKIDNEIYLIKNMNKINDDKKHYTYLGYYKFYLDRYLGDKIIESIRIDIGDGFKINKSIFEYLQNQLINNSSLIFDSIVHKDNNIINKI